MPDGDAWDISTRNLESGSPASQTGEQAMTHSFRTSLAALAALLCLNASAIAAPVVVGSVNPVTQQVTIFQDLLVTTFPDGTPIQHIYGRFDAVPHEFIMVRTGKMANGDCRTDALRLLRLSRNRLALAIDQVSNVPWNGMGTIHLLTQCLSGTCHGSCEVLDNPDTPQDLNDYICHCLNGECQSILPEVVTQDQLVLQEE
jgi:hypothetical protein